VGPKNNQLNFGDNLDCDTGHSRAIWIQELFKGFCIYNCDSYRQPNYAKPLLGLIYCQCLRRSAPTSFLAIIPTLVSDDYAPRRAGHASLPRPGLWNSLPPHLRDADLSYSQFWRSLKTFLFGQWGHGTVQTILTAPSRNNLTYLLTYYYYYYYWH